MTSRQSVSSILKPQKIRAPLKEIETVDQDVDEDTATMPKKKVSFSGMNNIKKFIASASSLTVPTLLDEQISMMSDSSNGDKTKLSEKLEKSDGQVTLESTNCTNVVENEHVVIDYESPNDNMEMTEALSGKIFSDTVYTSDNNISELNVYTMEYSANNMEFTEAVAVGQILTVDLSNSSSIGISETFINKDKQSSPQLEYKNSVPLHEVYCNNSLDDNMEFTQANIKSCPINLDSSSMNESCNMELTNIPLKSYCLNEDQQLCSMSVLTHDRQLSEDNCETGMIDKINENSNCELEIVYDLHPKSPEASNYLNNENIICEFENSNIDDEIVGKSSSSVVSMDIDSASKCNEDISYVNMDCLKLDNLDQTYPIVPIKLDNENKNFAVNDVHDDCSNVIEILKHTNSDVKTTTVSTNVSFVHDTSPKKKLIESIVVQEPQSKSLLLTHASILDKSDTCEMDISLQVEENCQINDSRKTLVHSASLVQEKLFANEDTFNTSALIEKNHQKRYSRKSVRLTPIIVQSSYKEDKYNSDLPDLLEEKKDVTVEENQPSYPRKSIACLPMLNIVQSPEKMNLSNASMHDETEDLKKENSQAIVEENLQKKYSRRTIGPTSISTFNNFLDNTDTSLSNNSFNISGNNVSISDNLVTSSIDDCNNSNNVSLVSNNSEMYNVDFDLNLSNDENNLISKYGHQSSLHNVIEDDDLNSPFRKKSKKIVSSLQSADQSVYNVYKKIAETSNNKENNSNNTVGVSYTENKKCSKVDISAEIEQDDYCIEKITSQGKDADLSTSFSINKISLRTRPSLILTDQTFCDDANTCNLMNVFPEHNPREKNVCSTKENYFSVALDNLQENKELGHNLCEKVIVLNEMKQNEIQFGETTEGCVNFKESNDDKSFRHSIDGNNICVDEISNMSDSVHQKYKKSSSENRKRSYSNLGSAPLSCSSFMHRPNDCNTEKFNEDTVLKESPVKLVSEISIKTEHTEENIIKEEIINEESVKENLNSEVIEFLRKWNDLYFVENKLVLDACNNSEWVFNILANNIKLIIKYSPIINEHSYLKVEDIVLITQISTEDEIIKFGTNWILSKYSPMVYKQICFTSRDVQLLLNSLQEDIEFISLVMKNMILLRDVYFVTFKDNKAKFYLESRNPLLMACIEVSLVNIRKLSVKDITVDILFGDFDLKVLDKIIETLTKDCNVLQQLVENLNTSIHTI